LLLRHQRLAPAPVAAPVAAPKPFVDTGIPHEAVKLSNMRKTIARRLAESKATIPHIYLTVDIRLDALLKLRGELNAALEPRGIKLSVNDMLIKALAAALVQVPACNVSFAGDTLIKYSRADISVAVSVPTGLITPIIADASNKALSAISTEMKALADKAKAGKAAAARVPGRHRQPVEHGHVRHQAVRSRHQPAAGHDHGDRRRRKAALCGERRAGDCHRHVRHRQLRPPRHRRRRRRAADEGVQGTV
jgi:pyruvate/2-oxoglutarate dehydrogenase complex dihydrolipoamide acyltransferase (E2) component